MGSIAISKIHPPSFKIRDDYGDLEELKASLTSKGLLQPIIIRVVGSDYEIVAGERRYISALELKWPQIDAKIIEATDQEAFEFALLENIQRKTMEPLEESIAFHAYVYKYGYGSVTTLALKIGKSTSYVSSRLSLVDTSDDIKSLIREKKLSVSAAEEVSRANTANSTRIAELASDIGLTPKQIRAAVNYSNSGMDADQAVQTAVEYPDYDSSKITSRFDPIKVAREQLVLTLRKTQDNLDENINRLPEGAEKAQWIHDIRFPVHQLIDNAMRIKKEFDR